MTVDAIRLQNFMGFQDTGWLELRPISLLFGKNSMGKSCIARALRLLKQSRMLGTPKMPLVFSVQDGLDLGGFLTAMHRTAPVEQYHPVQQEQPDRPTEPPLDIPLMTFHFRCSLPESVQAIRSRLHRDHQVSLPSDEVSLSVELSLTFRCSIEVDSRDRRNYSEQVELWSFALSYPGLTDGEPTPIQVFSAERIELSSQSDELELSGWYYWSDLLPIYADESESPVWQELTIGLASGFLPHIGDFNQMSKDISFIARILKELESVVGDFLDYIQYVGPIRPFPQRWYVLDREMQEQWKGQGWNGFAQFLGDKVQVQSQIDDINKWMKELKLASKLLAKREYSEPWALVAQVNLDEFEDGDETSNHTKLNLADVGLGMGQVLPVIVQCVTAPRGSLIIIEQPELHLHPGAQADMGDLFIQIINRCDDKNDEYVPYARFMIETHSEHLLLRLQRRLAESSANLIEDSEPLHVDRTKFQVFFVDRISNSSEINQVQMDQWGTTITPQSFRGFFSNDIDEIAALAEARIKSKTDK